MAEIELLFGGSQEEELIRSLDLLHCKHSSLLARFLLALEKQYPITDRVIEREAFVTVAIELVNQYSIEALPTLKDQWIEIQGKQVE